LSQLRHKNSQTINWNNCIESISIRKLKLYDFSAVSMRSNL